jgi:hypothetical protein
MIKVTLRLPKDFAARLTLLARDNRRSLQCECTRLIGWSLMGANRARRAKVAILAGTRAEARARALELGLCSDRWFYACSVEAATGRFVRSIEKIGTYRRHKRWRAIIRQLRGGIISASAQMDAAHKYRQ